MLGMNARQAMLSIKVAIGIGINLVSPIENEIRDAMNGYLEDTFVKAYGDGSQTTPHTWWASLGGIGILVPD